jgi:DNA repair exonuclease SbcCD ATPase subunit
MTRTAPTTRTERTADNAPTVANTGLVLRRAHGAWQRETDDEPAPPGYLEHMTAAVDKQIVNPLRAGAVPAADPAQAAKLEALTTANAALTTEVAELRTAADRHTATLAELDQAKSALTDLRSKNTNLQGELAEARAQLAELTAAAATAGPHEHLYARVEGTNDAEPCKVCGKDFPPTALRDALARARSAAKAEPVDVETAAA